MARANPQKAVVMADDDADDCFMATEAFGETGANAAFSCVTDGVELLDHLAEGSQSEERTLPDLIILDLNMPRKDGADTLLQIKSDPVLKSIPIIILTTSEAGEVASTVKSMADAFITKPASFGEWIDIMRSLTERWLT